MEKILDFFTNPLSDYRWTGTWIFIFMMIALVFHLFYYIPFMKKRGNKEKDEWKEWEPEKDNEGD